MLGNTRVPSRQRWTACQLPRTWWSEVSVAPVVMMAEAEECKGSAVTRVKLLTRCFCSAQVSEYVSDTISRECVEAGRW